MAWSEELPNGFYRGVWRDMAGAKRSATRDKTGRPFTQAAKAKNFAIGQEQTVRDDGPQNDGKGLMWGQWCERWLELRRVEPSTEKADAGRIEHHLRPMWADVRLAKITRTAIQAWVNTLADREDLSASTVRRIYYLLSASMKAAVKAGQLAVNPCQLVDLPSQAPAKEHYLTKAEFALIHSKMDPPYSDAAMILAYTGLRFGELAGLHWSRVDLEQKTLLVVETWDKVSGRIKAYPKSKKPRTVPLGDAVLEVLVRRASGVGTCGHPHAKGSICSSGLVLATVNGLPLDYSTMREQHFMPALDRAGVGHTRLHDLRHTYASWLAQDGVPLQVIGKMLGHGSVTVTERYSHIGAEQHARVLTALE